MGKYILITYIKLHRYKYIYNYIITSSFIQCGVDWPGHPGVLVPPGGHWIITAFLDTKIKKVGFGELKNCKKSPKACQSNLHNLS